jgi:transcription elongation factor Elf1
MTDLDPLGQWLEVACPYCGEGQSLLIEIDTEGEFVQDCQVCCQPWQVTVRRRSGYPEVDVEPL